MCGSSIRSLVSSPSLTGMSAPSTSRRVPSSTTSTSSSGIRISPSSVKKRPVSRSSSSSLTPPGPASLAATFAFRRIRNASDEEAWTSFRSLRSASTAIVSCDSTRPSPPHVGQIDVSVSRTPSVVFWRVISTRPSGEMSTR